MKNTGISNLCFILIVCVTAGMMMQCKDERKSENKSAVNVPFDSLRAKVNEWAWGESAVLGISPPDSIYVYIEELKRISEEKESWQDLCTALKARYFYYRGRDNFAETYRTLLEQVSAARKTNNDFLIVDALYLMGRLLSMNGNYLEGLDYFLQVADMNPSDPSLRVTLFYALAQQYTTIHQRDFALQYYDLAEAETHKPEYNNNSMKGWVTFGRGNMYLDMSDPILYEFAPLTPSRKDSLTTAISLWTDATQYVDNHNFFLSIALGYALLGDFEKAKAPEEKAIELGMLSQERMSFVNYYSAMIRYQQRRFSEAINYADKGLEVALANHNLADASYNLNVLYHANRMTGNDAIAIQYLEQKSALKDSMFVKEQQEQIIVKQIKFDTQLKEEQLRFEKEKNIHQLFRLRIVGLASAALLILSVILFRMYRQKQKAYYGLFLQIKEQDRLAEELERMQRVEKLQAPSLQQEESVNSRQRQLVALFREYLLREKKYTNPEINIDEIISALATNRTYLFEAVKTVTEKTPADYIYSMRLEEAKQMLEKRFDLNIETIAEGCGFNSRVTFYRLFRERYQMNPSEYRKIAKEKSGF